VLYASRSSVWCFTALKRSNSDRSANASVIYSDYLHVSPPKFEVVLLKTAESTIGIDRTDEDVRYVARLTMDNTTFKKSGPEHTEFDALRALLEYLEYEATAWFSAEESPYDEF